MNESDIKKWLDLMTERFIGHIAFSDDSLPKNEQELKRRLVEWLPWQ